MIIFVIMLLAGLHFMTFEGSIMMMKNHNLVPVIRHIKVIIDPMVITSGLKDGEVDNTPTFKLNEHGNSPVSSRSSLGSDDISMNED